MKLEDSQVPTFISYIPKRKLNSGDSIKNMLGFISKLILYASKAYFWGAATIAILLYIKYKELTYEVHQRNAL
jgi:hypothetical protein